MKPNDYAKTIGFHDVRMIRLLPGPIERIWSYLTEPEKRRKWLAGGPMELSVGGNVVLHFKHSEITSEKVPEKFKEIENGHTMHGQITHCDAPRLLAYTWSDEPDYHSEVTFELTPQGKNVQLILTHRRLKNLGEMKGVSGGWHAHVDVLGALLEGVEPPLFWTNFMRVRAAYDQSITES